MRFERCLLHEIRPSVAQPRVCLVAGDGFPLQTKIGVDGEEEGVDPTEA